MLRGEKPYIARMISQELTETYDDVLAIILFGSLARDMGFNTSRDGEADIDLLVVTMYKGFNPLETSLRIFHRFGVAVDIVHATLLEMLRWLEEKPPILFNILSGYQVLWDEGYVKPLLRRLELETLREWTYIKEKQLCIKKRLLPHISGLPGS